MAASSYHDETRSMRSCDNMFSRCGPR